MPAAQCLLLSPLQKPTRRVKSAVGAAAASALRTGTKQANSCSCVKANPVPWASVTEWYVWNTETFTLKSGGCINVGGGLFVQGKCNKQVQDVVERLWEFIEKLDINTFGKFLADNIVASVVTFSLLFWVPLSILVHCVVSLISMNVFVTLMMQLWCWFNPSFTVLRSKVWFNNLINFTCCCLWNLHYNQYRFWR